MNTEHDRTLLMMFAGYLSAMLPEYTNKHPEEIAQHVEPFLAVTEDMR
jgi:hypothetical protein